MERMVVESATKYVHPVLVIVSDRVSVVRL